MPERRVLAVGVFDLFHIGHLRYLEYAKQQGMHLTVAVTPDAIGLAVKGKSPVIPEQQRLEIVRGLRCVDRADFLPVSTKYAAESSAWMADWGVQHVVAGGIWQGSPRWIRLSHALAERGISVAFAPHTEGISSSAIVALIQNPTLIP